MRIGQQEEQRDILEKREVGLAASKRLGDVAVYKPAIKIAIVKGKCGEELVKFASRWEIGQS